HSHVRSTDLDVAAGVERWAIHEDATAECRRAPPVPHAHREDRRGRAHDHGDARNVPIHAEIHARADAHREIDPPRIDRYAPYAGEVQAARVGVEGQDLGALGHDTDGHVAMADDHRLVVLVEDVDAHLARVRRGAELQPIGPDDLDAPAVRTELSCGDHDGGFRGAV